MYCQKLKVFGRGDESIELQWDAEIELEDGIRFGVLAGQNFNGR
jgi:hypothetical protein